MILCVTHSNDYYNTELVIAHFKKMGETPIRFNTDEFLEDVSMIHTLNEDGMDVRLCIGEKSYSYKDFKGVWFRKLWGASVLSEIDEGSVESVAAEIRSSVFNFFHLIEEHCYCLNKMSNELEVERNKFRQLYEAKKCGLLTPETIVTNSFSEVAAFFNKHDQNIIAKLHNSISFSLEGNGGFFPTTAINRSNIEMLEDSVKYCPMIFQNNIKKAYELRIIYVDGLCFTGLINTTETEKGKTDWRNAENGVSTWESYELPQEQVDKLKKVMTRVNLSFGAIDMICTPKGEYIFLEINPSGEWGMLEKDLSLPISETIAKTIVKNS